MAKRSQTKPAIKNAKQTRGRPFAEGNRASPGRPPGSRSLAVQALDAIGNDAAQDVLKAVIAAAKRKDRAAAGLILRRVWPEPRGRLVPLDLPRIVDAQDVIGALAKIADALAAGVLTIDEA